MGNKISGFELKEKATLANEVYNIDKEKALDYVYESNGFQAMLVKNSNGEYTLAIAGTNDLQDFFLTDLSAFFSKTNPQFQSAREFLKKSLEYIAEKEKIDIEQAKAKLTLTGHSLGGNLVQLLGVENKITTYAFNALGASEIIEAMTIKQMQENGADFRKVDDKKRLFETLQEKILNANKYLYSVEINKDSVSSLNRDIGNTLTIESKTYNPKKAHEIEFVIKNIDENLTYEFAINNLRDYEKVVLGLNNLIQNVYKGLNYTYDFWANAIDDFKNSLAQKYEQENKDFDLKQALINDPNGGISQEMAEILLDDTNFSIKTSPASNSGIEAESRKMTRDEKLNYINQFVSDEMINADKQKAENERKNKLIDNFVDKAYIYFDEKELDKNEHKEVNLTDENAPKLANLMQTSDENTKQNVFSFKKLFSENEISKDELKEKLKNMEKNELLEFLGNSDFTAKFIENSRALSNQKSLIQMENQLNDEAIKNKKAKLLADDDKSLIINFINNGNENKDSMFKKIKDKALDSVTNMAQNAMKEAFDDIKEILKALIVLIKGTELSDKGIFDLKTAANTISGINGLQNGQSYGEILRGGNVTRDFANFLNAKQSQLGLRDRIIAHEGFRQNVYLDTKGIPTVGCGFLVSALTKDELALNGGKVEPMSKEVAEQILDLKLSKMSAMVDRDFPWVKDHPKEVKEVLVDMIYAMGSLEKWKDGQTLTALQNGEYEKAAQYLMQTKYYRDAYQSANNGGPVVWDATILNNLDKQYNQNKEYIVNRETQREQESSNLKIVVKD